MTALGPMTKPTDLVVTNTLMERSTPVTGKTISSMATGKRHGPMGVCSEVSIASGRSKVSVNTGGRIGDNTQGSGARIN